MNNNYKNGLECHDFEALLADALDQLLDEHTQAAFAEHGRTCVVCRPLLAEAREGMLLVRGLDKLEPPKNLVHNILASTSLMHASTAAASSNVQESWMERLRRSLRPSLGGLAHSRFAMSFAMAFFSISITLTLGGVKISDVTNMVAHPTAMRKNAVLGFTHVEAKVTSYYENLRLVYQVQAKVRELRKNTTPAPDNNENRQQNWKSAPGRERQQQHENYSRERDGSLIAGTNTQRQGVQI